MRKADSELENRIREHLIKMTYENEFNKYIGVELLELNPNYGKGRMKFRKEVLNPYGNFHGGALLSFADIMAGTTACMSGYYVQTVSSNLNFLLAARDTEYIYCECLKLKTGRNICVYDIRITDDEGNLLDSGEYCFFKSKQKVVE